MPTPYEQQVLDSGVPQEFLDTQRTLGKGGTFKGSNLDPQDVQPTIAAWNAYKASPQYGIAQVSQNLGGLLSQEYQFDPNKYLPAIQGQAESIYSPQQAQLEAIRQLQQSQYTDTKIQTEKDFQKRLQQEVEAVNRRGAYFSGGAIQNEQDIRDEQGRAMQQLSLQAGAANFSNLAQQALLQAEKAEFIRDRLVNSESGAYARWADQRNFSLQALQTQYQLYANERDFARNVFESDRAYALDLKKLDMQEKQFKQNYKITEEQFKQAKEQFNMDMQIKNLSYAQALKNFKSTTATNNSGIFGVNDVGADVEQGIWEGYSGANMSTNMSTPSEGSLIYEKDVQFGF